MCRYSINGPSRSTSETPGERWVHPFRQKPPLPIVPLKAPDFSSTSRPPFFISSSAALGHTVACRYFSPGDQGGTQLLIQESDVPIPRTVTPPAHGHGSPAPALRGLEAGRAPALPCSLPGFGGVSALAAHEEHLGRPGSGRTRAGLRRRRGWVTGVRMAAGAVSLGGGAGNSDAVILSTIKLKRKKCT